MNVVAQQQGYLLLLTILLFLFIACLCRVGHPFASTRSGYIIQAQQDQYCPLGCFSTHRAMPPSGQPQVMPSMLTPNQDYLTTKASPTDPSPGSLFR
jgi:hypothetical protein